MNKETITGIIMVIIFIIGMGIGYYFSPQVQAPASIATEDTTIESTTNDTADDNATTDTSVSDSVPEGGVTIDSSKMSDGQKQLLRTLGVDPDNITLTPEMVACAEAKVGTARLAEIQNGATPSFMEGASLVTCYR